MRRGLASANAIFGNKASVLVGDFLFARSFQLMVDDGSLRVLAILSKAAATIAEGEVLQLVTQNDLSTTEGRYLEVIQGKTAALFAAACQIGAVVANRPDREEQALAAYGMKLGIAFQLVDDALDDVADEATLGKTIGDDFREGKITLPVLTAFLAGDDREKAFWQRTIESLEQTDEDLDHAMQLIARHGAIKTTLDRAQRFVQEAKDALLVFPDSPIRRALEEVRGLLGAPGALSSDGLPLTGGCWLWLLWRRPLFVMAGASLCSSWCRHPGQARSLCAGLSRAGATDDAGNAPRSHYLTPMGLALAMTR